LRVETSSQLRDVLESRLGVERGIGYHGHDPELRWRERASVIRGERVILTALDPVNAPLMQGWINDPDVNRYMLVGHVPLTLAQEQAYYSRIENSDNAYGFEVHVAEDMRLIGHVGLEGVDLRHRHGEIGIVIGDQGSQGRGYGRDALVTMMRFGFDTLGLHRIGIKARTDNERGLHLYRSIGFKDAGVERDLDFAEGRFFDVVGMDMLEDEFRRRYPRG
jgi:RimJ/RimL family protein N-acetyltransferase